MSAGKELHVRNVMHNIACKQALRMGYSRDLLSNNSYGEPVCSLGVICSIESSVHVRHRLHYARGMWKHSYIITTVMPTFHTNPSWKRSSSKTTFKPEAFINTSFPFYCGRKTFWKWSFSKTMTSRWSCDFPARDFLKHKFKMTGDWCVFKFPLGAVDGA